MTIETTIHKRCHVLTMTGRIDSSNADELHDAFKSIQANGKNNIVFDMSNIDFMSSRGWWVMIETQKSSKAEKGELVLSGVNENITQSLDLIGMTEYFKIFDNVTNAVGSF